MQILKIRSQSEYGIFLVQPIGWPLLVSRYWLRSVSFLYKSISRCPSSILQDVSRKGIEDLVSHLHLSVSDSDSMVVCCMVNLSVG